MKKWVWVIALLSNPILADQCQITSPLPMPVLINGCTYSGNLPGNSTSYIQNNLLPTTTTQAFSVQTATVTDNLSLPFLTPGQCATTSSSGFLESTSCGTGGGGGSSTLAITAGVSRSSPTSDAIFPASEFNGAVSASSMTITLNTSSVTLQGPIVSSITLGSMYGAPTLTGTNFSGVPTTSLSGILQASQFPALTGDITTTAGSLATTAAASQSNIKTFTSPITFTSSITAPNVIYNQSTLQAGATAYPTFIVAGSSLVAEGPGLQGMYAPITSYNLYNQTSGNSYTDWMQALSIPTSASTAQVYASIPISSWGGTANSPSGQIFGENPLSIFMGSGILENTVGARDQAQNSGGGNTTIFGNTSQGITEQSVTPNQYAFYAQTYALNGSTVTNNYGLFVSTPNSGNTPVFIATNSVVTNNYGIYIDSMTYSGVGGTVNYGIYEAQGQNFFGGTSAFNSGVKTSTIQVTGMSGGGTQCVQVDNNGNETGTGSACGSGGGGGLSTLAVTTGSANGFSVITTSPTSIVNFDSSTFKSFLEGGSTAFVQLNPSSVTLQGLVTAGSLGALTSNQTITVSGDESGSGSTAIALTANATQSNIRTFTSSETISGPNGLLVNYQVSAGSFTGAGLTNCNSSGDYIQWASANEQYGCSTTYPPASIASGSLGSSVIASSIAVNAVYPGAVSAATYSNITLPATNLSGAIPTVNLPPGTSIYIQNTSSLQSGATAYPSYEYIGSSEVINGELRIQNFSTLYNNSLHISTGPPNSGVTPEMEVSSNGIVEFQAIVSSASSFEILDLAGNQAVGLNNSSDLLSVKYGLSVGSITDTSQTGSTQCAEFTSAGLLQGTGSTCGSGGGGGSPGGSPTQLQYNLASAFAGDPYFNLNPTSATITENMVVQSTFSANVLAVSSSTTGQNFVAVSSTPAQAPGDYLLQVSSANGNFVWGVQNNSVENQTDNGNTFQEFVSTALYISASTSTTVASLQALPGMSFQIGANEIWGFQCYFFAAGATGGAKFGVNGPSGATVQAAVFGGSTSAATFTNTPITALATANATACLAGTGADVCQLSGTMAASSTSGSWTLERQAGTSGDSITINAGSYCNAQRIQ